MFTLAGSPAVPLLYPVPLPLVLPVEPQLQRGNQRIQVNNLIAALEGVVPVQQNVLPSQGFRDHFLQKPHLNVILL